MTQITVREIDLLLDALTRAAARHQSLAAALKPGSYYVGKHDRAAAEMMELRLKLVQMKHYRQPAVVETLWESR